MKIDEIMKQNGYVPVRLYEQECAANSMLAKACVEVSVLCGVLAVVEITTLVNHFKNRKVKKTKEEEK